MGVKKNKHCEEWNNLREDTHKTWEFNAFTTPRVLLAIPVAGLFFHYVAKADLEIDDDLSVKENTRANRTTKACKKYEYL